MATKNTLSNPRYTAPAGITLPKGTVIHAGTYAACHAYNAAYGNTGQAPRAAVNVHATGTLVWVAAKLPKAAFKKPRGLAKANCVHSYCTNGGSNPGTVGACRAALAKVKYSNPTKGRTPVGNNLAWLIGHGFVVVVQAKPAYTMAQA